MFDIALGIFLFLSPIFTLIGNHARVNGIFVASQFYQFGSMSFSVNAIQLQFFEFGVLALLAVAFAQKQKRKFKDKWVGLLFAVFLVNMILHPKTIPSFTPILFGFLLFYLVVAYSFYLKRLFYCIAAVAFLNTLFTVLQYNGIRLIYSGGRLDGLMCITNHLAIYQALSIPICYFINPFFIIIPFISLILSGNMTALVGATVGIMYLFIKKIALRGSIVLMSFMSLVAFFLIKFFNYEKLIGRVWGWDKTIKAIFQKPFSGHGIGTFSLFRETIGVYANPYNIYLGIAYALGIVGIIILLLAIREKMFDCKTKISRAIFASCLIILTIGMGQSIMDFPRLAGTVIVLFAFLKIRQGDELCGL